MVELSAWAASSAPSMPLSPPDCCSKWILGSLELQGLCQLSSVHAPITALPKDLLLSGPFGSIFGLFLLFLLCWGYHGMSPAHQEWPSLAADLGGGSESSLGCGGPEERAAEHGAACEGISSLWDTELLFAEMDESLRSFAEKVFASEVKDEEVKGEISHFDVEDSCPISRKEMTVHMMLQEASSTVEKR